MKRQLPLLGIVFSATCILASESADPAQPAQDKPAVTPRTVPSKTSDPLAITKDENRPDRPNMAYPKKEEGSFEAGPFWNLITRPNGTQEWQWITLADVKALRDKGQKQFQVWGLFKSAKTGRPEYRHFDVNAL